MLNHFLILALNEELLLKKTFMELKEVIRDTKLDNYTIYIVDDGSDDKTLEVANQLKAEIDTEIKIIINKKNIGTANSIKNFIKEQESGNLFIISGDNDLDKNLVKNLIYGSKNSDFVLSYYINREEKGWLRANISTLFNLILCTIFNVYAFYLQGPVVWPIKIIKNFNISSSGIAYASEVNIKLLNSGLTFVEVPGHMNTGSVNSTSIKLKNFLDIIKTIISLFIEFFVKKKFTKKSKRLLFLHK
jgi:glycosyltransferase involved in cell wall biosynthesis